MYIITRGGTTLVFFIANIVRRSLCTEIDIVCEAMGLYHWQDNYKDPCLNTSIIARESPQYSQQTASMAPD